ncbi:MAG: hypothetical protein M5R41_10425 [Bacteroidia bacterium]|nr:hypothetical protein [Bacteroidia bacterium]
MTRRSAIALNCYPEPDSKAPDIVFFVGPGCLDFSSQLSGQDLIFRGLGGPLRSAIALWNAIVSRKVTDEQRIGNRMQNIASRCLDALHCKSVEITWLFPDDLPLGAQLTLKKKKKPPKKKKPRKHRGKQTSVKE